MQQLQRRNQFIPDEIFRPRRLSFPEPPTLQAIGGSGGLERVFEIGPAFRAEKHDTYRHLNEFVSFDIEMAWASDEDVMGVQERMIHHIWSQVAENEQHFVDDINAYRLTQDMEPIEVIPPTIPFPRVSYCDAIDLIQQSGQEIEWGDDIEAHHADIIAKTQWISFHSTMADGNETVLHLP